MLAAKSRPVPLFWSEDYWSANERRSIRQEDLRRSARPTIYFSASADEVLVPGKATFGGWWLNDGPALTVSEYEELFSDLIAREPAKSWKFCLPPRYFHPEIFLSQRAALENIGGSVVNETNSSIMLHSGEEPLGMRNFSRGNRKRVRQFLERGGTIEPAAPNEIPEAYRLLRENRARRGARLSLGQKKFARLLEILPHNYSLWVARIDLDLVGAAYLVELDPEVSYVLFWGDSVTGRQLSVTAAMCLTVQDYAFRRGKKVLDLGVSSVNGVIDVGLLKFKQNLGAQSFEQPQILVTAKEATHTL